MALFSRVQKDLAEQLVQQWPSHYWIEKSVYFLLSQAKNKEHIKNIPLNEGLLESVKKVGFESPFLVLQSWYPVCGSQRLRVALELGEKWQKKQKVEVCRFTTQVYEPLFYWPNKQEGHKSVQQYFQMLEVVFKTLYMPSHDTTGKLMVDYEEEGNQLHWPARDGGKQIAPKIVASNDMVKVNPMANAIANIQFGNTK